MTYVYAAMWFIVGLILIFRMAKENKVFYGAGAFFLLLGGWWLADAILPGDQFAGTAGWVLRGITAVALLAMCVAFFRENQLTKKKAEAQAKSEQDDSKEK